MSRAFRVTAHVRIRSPRPVPAAPPTPAPSVAMPSLLERARHAAGAAGRVAGRVAGGGSILRTRAEADACLAACMQCPDRRGAACLHCGCILRFKARLATEQCPHPAGSRWPDFFSNL